MRHVVPLLFLLLQVAHLIAAEPTTDYGIAPAEAERLAILMCSQIPNLTTIIDGKDVAPRARPADRPVDDDVYDALMQLGHYSVPCLVDRLTDTQWMPDPRYEPLLGVPVVGDVACMVLMDKGVPDILPQLAHKDPTRMRMDDWFLWPAVPAHRRLLSRRVRSWVTQHPHCCDNPPITTERGRVQPAFRMSGSALAEARRRFARLRLGMTPAQVSRIAGKPDAVEKSDDAYPAFNEATGLLGICAGDRNENLAYLFFIERWTNQIARRNPLKDRYVILFFSVQGRFTRMFSNVAEIPPVFPVSRASWLRLITPARSALQEKQVNDISKSSLRTGRFRIANRCVSRA